MKLSRSTRRQFWNLIREASRYDSMSWSIIDSRGGCFSSASNTAMWFPVYALVTLPVVPFASSVPSAPLVI